MRWPAGTRRTATGQLDGMAEPRLSELQRCERPREPVASFDGDQPGGLAQGPEEKNGRAGRSSGLAFDIRLSSERARRVGTAWPSDALRGRAPCVKRRQAAIAKGYKCSYYRCSEEGILRMLENLPPRERQIVDILYERKRATVAEVGEALQES